VCNHPRGSGEKKKKGVSRHATTVPKPRINSSQMAVMDQSLTAEMAK
jgi:hypothetical protein